MGQLESCDRESYLARGLGWEEGVPCKLIISIVKCWHSCKFFPHLRCVTSVSNHDYALPCNPLTPALVWGLGGGVSGKSEGKVD